MKRCKQCGHYEALHHPLPESVHAPQPTAGHCRGYRSSGGIVGILQACDCAGFVEPEKET